MCLKFWLCRANFVVQIMSCRAINELVAAGTGIQTLNGFAFGYKQYVSHLAINSNVKVV